MGMEPTGRGGLLLGGMAMLPLRWNLQLCRRGRILIGGIAIATQMPLVYLHITEVPSQDASGLDVVSTPHTDSPVM